MNEADRTTHAFEEQRPRLRAVAYRMLGSTAEADDAVQEAWLRLQRVDSDEIENLGGWLTTVSARIALEHAALPRHPARAAASNRTCRSRSSTRSTAPTPSTRR